VDVFKCPTGNTINHKHSYEFKLVYANSKVEGSIGAIVALFVVIAVAVGGFVFYRRRRRLSSDNP
jgi:hypothetical protein